jgi:hypothetical protein
MFPKMKFLMWAKKTQIISPERAKRWKNQKLNPTSQLLNQIRNYP